MFEPALFFPTVEIHATGLKVSYDPSFTLSIPSLNVRGRIIAVIGHNGSGKSTMMKSMLGLLAPKAGSLHLSFHHGGEHIPLVPEKHMAFSPETGAVFADVSVESYVKLWCRIKQNRGDYYRRGGAEVIERLEIGPLLKKLGRELSKGQRRRVQTAVGFLAEPKLFLFDEPFDGLDIIQSNQLSELMRERSASMGMFISSHRMEVVERLADTVLVLQNGRIVAAGAPEKVCAELAGGDGTATLADAMQSFLKNIH